MSGRYWRGMEIHVALGQPHIPNAFLALLATSGKEPFTPMLMLAELTHRSWERSIEEKRSN